MITLSIIQENPIGVIGLVLAFIIAVRLFVWYIREDDENNDGHHQSLAP